MNTQIALKDYVSQYLAATNNTYNSDAYGTGRTYGCAQGDTTCLSQAEGGSNNGGLADTGYSIFIPIIIAGALLIAGAILLTKRIIRRRKQNA